ncbi:MAG: hypothetical protein ACEY3D_03990 [Rickettsia sp.]|uniref:hypothetical protein n=1 Tax=Rickettsia sp. TaxID=789 RepID=UPI00397AE3F3
MLILPIISSQVATSHKVYAKRQKRLEQTRLADIERETERKTLGHIRSKSNMRYWQQKQ